MTNLLIIGASCRAAAQSARATGFTPAAIDWFADRDLAEIARVEQITTFAEAAEVATRMPDGPWMYCGGMENQPDVVETLAAVRPLWGNSAATLRAVRDPATFFEACRTGGLPGPEIRTALDVADVPQRWLRKKILSSGGLGVEFAADRAPRPGWYFQQRLTGESASAAFVSAGDAAVLLGTSGQLIGAPFHAPRPFQYAGSFAPYPLKPEQLDALRRFGQHLTQIFGLVGLWGLDFLITDDGRLHPLELNPRYCASFELLEAQQSRAFVTLHAAACVDGSLPEETQAKTPEFFGKQIVYADRPCEVTTAQTAWFDRKLASGAIEIADVPAPGTAFQPGDPLATVFARATSPAELFPTLNRRRDELLAQFR